MSWTMIRNGVLRRLATIEGLNGRARDPLAQASNDEAIVLPADQLLTPDTHQGGLNVNFTVRLKVRRTTFEAAQLQMDEYLWPTGSKSVIGALYASENLPVLVDSVETDTVEGTRFVEVVGYEPIPEVNGVQADINFTAKVGTP